MSTSTFFTSLALIFIALYCSFWGARKGFNGFLWFFAGGVVALCLLPFLPDASDVVNLTAEERYRRLKIGNHTAIGLICVPIVLMLLVRSHIL